ncbi:MAG: hypothetical protein RLZZ292_3676 [Bacteroidota bacterium]|jgi:hypothetical protein
MKKITFFFAFFFCATLIFAQKTNIVAGVSAAYQGNNSKSYGSSNVVSDRSTGVSLGYQLGKYLEFGGKIAVNVKKNNYTFDDKSVGYHKQETILHSFGTYFRGYYPLTKSIRFFVQPSATSMNGKETSDAFRTYIDGHQETKIGGSGFQFQPGVQFHVGNSLRIEVLMSGSTYSKQNYELIVSTNKNYPIGEKHSENNFIHNYSLSNLQLGVSWLF